MPMQAIQGMPLQAGSAKNSPESTKADPADFFNILANLLMPSPQAQIVTIPDAETVPLNPDSRVKTEQAMFQVQLQPNQPVLPAAEHLIPAKQEAPTGEELTALLDPKGVTAKLMPEGFSPGAIAEGESIPPETPPAPKEEGLNRSMPNQAEIKTSEMEGEARIQAPEPDKESKPADRQAAAITLTPLQVPDLAVQNKPTSARRIGTDTPEPVNQDKPNVGVLDISLRPDRAEAGQSGQDDQTGLDLKGPKELTAGEENSRLEDSKPFADLLQKEVTSGKEVKTEPLADLKMSGREIVRELPRIIESQVKNAAGKEISRDIIIHLEPKELGKLTVKLTAQEGVVTVKIFAEHAETRNLVEAGFANLRQSFSEQGIKYGRMEAELGGQFLFQQQQQPQQQQQGQQSQRVYPHAGTQLWEEISQQSEKSYNQGSSLKSNGTVDYRI